jgi:hypothetical protein
MGNRLVSDITGFFREYALFVSAVIICAVVAWFQFHRQGDTSQYSKIDPFSGVLVVDAPGCKITGPDGKSLKDELRGKDRAVIPQGSTLNGSCFPATEAARNEVPHE